MTYQFNFYDWAVSEFGTSHKYHNVIGTFFLILFFVSAHDNILVSPLFWPLFINYIVKPAKCANGKNADSKWGQLAI